MVAEAPAPPTPELALRIAVTNLACAPQAQRRYVQLGMLQRACATVERMAPAAEQLEFLDDGQRERLRGLGAELARLRETGADFMHEGEPSTREFLHSKALEDPGWAALRHAARRLFTQLRDRPAPAGVDEP